MKAAHRISLGTATAIVVADIIGTGVFTTLGFQVAVIPSGFAVMLLWLVGGIAALCGALSYGELAATLPRSGGEYSFLSRIYHPAVGFVAGWVSATVGFAAPTALAALAFGQYFTGIIPGAPPVLVSTIVVVAISLVHLRGARPGSAFQNAFTALKIALIVALIVAGLLAEPQPLPLLPVAGDSALIWSAPFAASLVYVMYAYSGWNASTYITGEVENPRRNVPRSLLIGTLVVMALYLAINAVFLRTTPIAEMAGKVEVGLIAGKHIFGEAGGQIMGGLICLGLVSAISSLIWIGPRVTMTMGEDHRALALLARRTRHGVPAAAILFQLALVLVMLLTTSFEVVLVYVQFSLIACSFLAVLGVFVLRIREPDLPRPYRTWGYPVTPAIFLAVSLFMMVSVLWEKPLESLAGLATMLAGLLVYFLSPKTAPHTNP